MPSNRTSSQWAFSSTASTSTLALRGTSDNPSLPVSGAAWSFMGQGLSSNPHRPSTAGGRVPVAVGTVAVGTVAVGLAEYAGSVGRTVEVAAGVIEAVAEGAAVEELSGAARSSTGLEPSAPKLK